jgi:hypothetical protein
MKENSFQLFSSLKPADVLSRVSSACGKGLGEFIADDSYQRRIVVGGISIDENIFMIGLQISNVKMGGGRLAFVRATVQEHPGGSIIDAVVKTPFEPKGIRMISLVMGFFVSVVFALTYFPLGNRKTQIVFVLTSIAFGLGGVSLSLNAAFTRLVEWTCRKSMDVYKPLLEQICDANCRT